MSLFLERFLLSSQSNVLVTYKRRKMFVEFIPKFGPLVKENPSNLQEIMIRSSQPKVPKFRPLA